MNDKSSRKGIAVVIVLLFGISIIPSSVGVDDSTIPTFDDIIPPVITNIVLTTSDPLDTSPGFGWENFSCTVTDNIGVDIVRIIITYPYGTVFQYSMTNILGTDVYYFNTIFTDAGYYVYSIWTVSYTHLTLPTSDLV